MLSWHSTLQSVTECRSGSFFAWTALGLRFGQARAEVVEVVNKRLSHLVARHNIGQRRLIDGL